MKNRVLPVVIGLLAGWVTIFVLEFLNHQIYPAPEGADLSTKEGVVALMEVIPTGAFVLLFVSWMVSAFVAGGVTAMVNQVHWRNNAIIVGVILSIGALINMVIIPHPTWLVLASGIGYVPGSFFGARLFKNFKK